ncbi:hypothetical protein GPJ56_008927 [Histomonas meleagridis]|uniref:uncharacterized protein n=1 Tax=Histomonas meleagridis TaxID=135588 RepID=UPI003559E0B0|nr:hypothetical protein GPJ56_008927 [Histomonas meleagridis]KAH0797853.1 hypothetical protein GO595_009482 [Histomonas meleagridis]
MSFPTVTPQFDNKSGNSTAGGSNTQPSSLAGGQTGTSLFSNSNFTNAFAKKDTNSTGSSAFSFNFNTNKQEQLISENTKLEEIKKMQDDSKEKKDNYVYAASILNDIIQMSNEVQKEMSPIEGAEAFDKKLSSTLEDAQRLLSSMISISHEIGNGNSEISKFRNDLETSKHETRTALRQSHSSASSFLHRYVSLISKRSKVINETINTFENALNHDYTSPTYESLSNLLQEQHKVILRCSSRVSTVKTAVKKFREEHSDQTTSLELQDDSESKASLTESIVNEYNEFLQGRKRDLEKRETNADKFKKPEQKAYSFGSTTTGNQWNGFGQNNSNSSRQGNSNGSFSSGGSLGIGFGQSKTNSNQKQN